MTAISLWPPISAARSIRSVLAPILLALASLTLLAATGASGAEPEIIDSPTSLWHGYDPEAEPLEIETLKSWEEDGSTFQTLRFTGERVGDARVRIYAIQGAPISGNRVPGVLHVHGGGQTASLEWVKLWAKRGYACVSFDFCGPIPGRTENVTNWGPIPQGNMAQAAGGFQLTPTPRESSWFHWAAVSRRALTLLARHPRVDAQRLGVYGISVGGSLAWMIAATDHRVKAAAPIYGCGYNYDRRNPRWGLPPNDDRLNLFQRVLSSEAHAPGVTCPVLFLSASNDFHGAMDRAYDTLSATPGPDWQVFTPRTNHHLEPVQGRDLGLWMDWHLKGAEPWPQTPELQLGIDANGIPEARINPAQAADVERVEVYYHLGDKRPAARFWRTATATRNGEGWNAPLPVMDVWDDFHVFTNVTYRRGVCLTSALRHSIPGQLGKARASLTWSPSMIDGPTEQDHWTFTNGYTDPSIELVYLQSGRDADGRTLITFDAARLGDPVSANLSTHIIGDPQFVGRDGWQLSFECRGGFTSGGLKVTVISNDWGLGSRRFTALVPQSETNVDWHEIHLPLSRFVDTEGKSPAHWSDLDKLEIQGSAAQQAPPQFSRLRWHAGS